jgi:hypothetical protein
LSKNAPPASPGNDAKQLTAARQGFVSGFGFRRLTPRLQLAPQIGHILSQVPDFAHQVFFNLALFVFDFFPYKDGGKLSGYQRQHRQPQQHHNHRKNA